MTAGEGDEKGKVMGIFRSLGALSRALGPVTACTGKIPSSCIENSMFFLPTTDAMLLSFLTLLLHQCSILELQCMCDLHDWCWSDASATLHSSLHKATFEE